MSSREKVRRLCLPPLMMPSNIERDGEEEAAVVNMVVPVVAMVFSVCSGGCGYGHSCGHLH